MLPPRAHIVRFLLLAAMGGGAVSAQPRIAPDVENRLWIEGRSNISSFACQAREYQVRARLHQGGEWGEPATLCNERVDLEVIVPIAGFECGRKGMDQDLRAALKADRFPAIRFSFAGAEIASLPARTEGVYRFRISGQLEVAGVGRDIHFPVESRYQEDGRVRAKGRAALRMTDHAIEPPTGLYGLIRVRDRFEVHFEFAVESSCFRAFLHGVGSQPPRDAEVAERAGSGTSEP